MNPVIIGLIFAFLQVGYPVSSFIVSPVITDEDATKACISELKLDESTLTTLDMLEHYDENNPSCGKLLSCTWKKLGLQDGGGNVNFDKLKKYLVDFTQQRVDAGVATTAASESLVAGWFENCRGLHGADHGQTALKIHFCIAEGIKTFIKSQA